MPSPFPCQRPAAPERTFTSNTVERAIASTVDAIADPELAWLFSNCFPNTLDTTVDFELIDGRPDTFIITGDIDALWLRDSTAQIWPYLPLINEDAALREMAIGLVHRQVKCVLLDPYANAFYKDFGKVSKHNADRPSPKPGVHERKWEIDSLCYVVRLAHEVFRLTGDPAIFTDDFDRAMRLIVATFRTEQRLDGQTPYRFERTVDIPIDAPPFQGTGHPVKPCGLICSAFRPSDDSTIFPFLVPANLFAMLSLRQLSALYSETLSCPDFAAECAAMADVIHTAIQRLAVTEHLDFGPIYAYEVDGYGNRIFMDDANVPSLMSLAYLEPAFASDPVYQNTRRFLLSEANPYYLRGSAAEGQGSPHTGKDSIWPMGVILRALTSTDEAEIRACLQTLANTHAGTGFMHESFHRDDPAVFSRTWFAWANTLFGELILQIQRNCPKLLQETFTD
ncbi:glycoside hydrolase family 125 protein [Cerasicoccus fimbriatus]|uniref:glycoside hydrolase family 125 protein n=1 Tax=Cerasicoccus fimbriatus TaxID=3014554 RepID=UPI0022B56C72|nr:glycoside hydrolase family 125 protein [Cerasicoccus sp. TK19100]